jgi:23S rRNA (guanine745-N1)-methyltransferase
MPQRCPRGNHGAVHPDVVTHLRCPTCRAELVAVPGRLRCPGEHSFDLARQGYADLSGGRLTHAGDTAEMVKARADVLAAGHFDFVAEAVIAAVRGYPPGLVVDVGAGTGFHLARLLDARPGLVGLAVEASKPALRRAARAHPRLAAVRADAWRRLPLPDACAAAVINVFAPRQAAEFRRILRPDGVLVTVTPMAGHLRTLVDTLGLLTVAADKQERLATALRGHFTPGARSGYRRRLRLTRAEVRAFVAMGPSAWHRPDAVPADQLVRLPEPFDVTAEVCVQSWLPVRRI